jgi:ribosome biogenesis GTPase A
MKPRYSFSSRHTGNLDNINKQREKFPAVLRKVIDRSDIILQVLDARFIEDTRNVEIEESIKRSDKRIIYVLNKSDLINKKNLPPLLLKEIKPYVLVSAKTRTGSRELRDRIKQEAKKTKKILEGKFSRIQVGIIGQPNTGKSSIINLLIGKSSAKTGAQAGFTKGIQKLRLSEDVILLDSPGVIPKARYTTDVMEKISIDAKVGARSPNKLRNPDLAVTALFNEFPRAMKKFYNVNVKVKDPEEFIEMVGRKSNFLKKGNEVDEDKTSRKIIHDWQSGKIRIN